MFRDGFKFLIVHRLLPPTSFIRCEDEKQQPITYNHYYTDERPERTSRLDSEAHQESYERDFSPGLEREASY